MCRCGACACNKPVLLQAKNTALCLCVCLREREWRKRPSRSTWACIKVYEGWHRERVRERVVEKERWGEKTRERIRNKHRESGQMVRASEASPGGQWVSGSPLLLSHSTFHSNTLTSQPGSRKNEKKYRGGGRKKERTHSPPQAGIEPLPKEFFLQDGFFRFGAHCPLEQTVYWPALIQWHLDSCFFCLVVHVIVIGQVFEWHLGFYLNKITKVGVLLGCN